MQLIESYFFFCLGPLNPIVNPVIAVANRSLSWDPPFTLDLPDISLDIVYCVDVYNISCQYRELLNSDCQVQESVYSYGVTFEGEADLIEVVVTPTSDALLGNGTPTVISGNRSSHNIIPMYPLAC